MSYRYLDHGADMGLEGRGSSTEEAFEEAAKAMFGLMVELDEVKPEREVGIKVEGKDRETLFYNWMAELLTESNLKETVFSSFSVNSIDKSSDGDYILLGEARGQTYDGGIKKIGEVKGVTFMGLEVRGVEGNWKCRGVVDL